MIETSKKITVGIFVLVCLVLLVFIVFLAGSGRGVFTRSHTVYVKYKHIKGLQVGASVHLAGIDAGYIKEISFQPTQEKFEVLVTLKIIARYFPLIRQDSEASITTRGLLGDKYVQISLGSIESPPVSPGDYIQPKIETSVMDQLQGGGIVEKIDTVIVSFNDVLEQVRSGNKLERALENLVSVSDKLDELTDTFKDDKTPIGQILSTNPETQLNKSITNIHATSESMSNVMRKVDEGYGTIGALINDPTLYEDLKVLLGGAKRNALLKFVVRESLKKAEQADHF